jgi:glycosyltransferase involved in cell wall biosynthesis
MLIVHVLTRLLRAGAEENTLETAAAQQQDGHRVVIVHGEEFDEEIAAKARSRFDLRCERSLVHQIAPLRDAKAVARLARLFDELRPDVVHTHQSKAGVLGRFAARQARVPVIVHGVHILPWVQIRRSKRLVYLAAERFCAAFTDVFIDVSPAVRAECLAQGIGRADQHMVSFSPMPVERFRNAAWPQDWREITGVGDDGPENKPAVILMLAAFEPRKRQLQYLHALATSACPSDAILLFAGEGPEKLQVEDAARRLGWADRVRFLGHRSDPERLIALADVCVLSSVREGLPRVIVQYAAGGRAIVVTRVPGLEDVIGDGENAIIVDTVPDAARATVRLLRNPRLRERLAEGAAATDVMQWSIERTYPKVREAYDRAAERAQRSGRDRQRRLRQAWTETLEERNGRGST